MSQYTLADKLATIAGRPTIGRDRVARWERGRQVPRAEWRRWLAAALDIPVEDLDAGAVVARRQTRVGTAAVTTPAPPPSGIARRAQGTPALLPVFRSRVAAGVLAATLMNPERAYSLTELAEHAGASLASVSKEAELLAHVGILTTRYHGPIRLTQAATGSPLSGPLTELIRLTYGVPQVVAEEFGHVHGIDRIALTGAWAERFAGVTGPHPTSIHVRLTLAGPQTPDRHLLARAAERASQRLKRPVAYRVALPGAGTRDVRHAPRGIKGGSGPGRMPTQRRPHPVVHVEPVSPPAASLPRADHEVPGDKVVGKLIDDGDLELISGTAADENPYLDLAASTPAVDRDLHGRVPVRRW